MTAAQGQKAWLQSPWSRVGAIASLLFLLLGFVSIAWTPHAIDALNVGAALQDPGAIYWLGTDHLGRDVLSLLMKGTLTSFIVAAVAVVIGAVLGIPLGLAAASASGSALDSAILRVNDFLALPALILAIMLATLIGPGAVVIMLAMGAFNTAAFSRVARLGLLAVKDSAYVGAARLAGLTVGDIARRHFFSTIAGLVLAQALTQLALGVLAEASLSYFGLGVQTPAASLGLMLKDAQTYALLKPTLALVPGVVIVLIVVALNLAADGFRAQLDPRLRLAGDAHDPA